MMSREIFRFDFPLTFLSIFSRAPKPRSPRRFRSSPHKYTRNYKSLQSGLGTFFFKPLEPDSSTATNKFSPPVQNRLHGLLRLRQIRRPLRHAFVDRIG